MSLTHLLHEYDRLIYSIEQQSCVHAGENRSGHDWQYCCGVSYEYLNDINVRDLIALQLTTNELTRDENFQLVRLDHRLQVLLAKNEVSMEGSIFWKNGLPYGVIP
jgi:hypothetical protein